MRKLLVAVLALGLVAAMRTSSFAAFASQGITSVTALVSFSSGGSASMSIAWSAGGSLTWASPAPTIGTTKWQKADNYILLHSTITSSTGGVEIYTDNLNGGTSSYTGTGNPAGLISMSSTTQTLPMCWRAVDVSTTSLTIVQGTDNNLYASENGGMSSKYPCYEWIEDAHTSGFVKGFTDYSVIRDYRGVQIAGSTWAQGIGSPVIVYFGANFTTATQPNTYVTQTLRIEAYMD